MKEYDKDAKLKLEEEFMKGKTWKGKEYNYNEKGNLLFEGKYLNGKRNGKGKNYLYGKLIFEGENLKGKKMENGKLKRIRIWKINIWRRIFKWS